MKYLPHAQAALDVPEHPMSGNAGTRLLFNVAGSYSLLGQYQKAENMYRHTLQLKENE
jgi:hypothetical protein